jgi:peptidoglycan/LPS O-acetylase OafA/YrhL
LFFVLSGYLITGILQDGRDKANRARNFYVRRFLRLGPLYYVVLLGWFLVLPAVAPGWSGCDGTPFRSQLWCWAYAANWGLIVGNVPGPLGIFWSLAIEEHFYLVWPRVIWHLSRRHALRLSLGLILVGMAARITLAIVGLHPVNAWLLDTYHVESLSMGAAIALAIRGPRGSRPLVQPARLVAAVSVAWLAGLVLWKHTLWQHQFLHVNREFQIYGNTPLTLLIGSGMVLACHASPGSPAGALVASRFLRFFGKYSYGLYVWHGVLYLHLERLCNFWKVYSCIPSFPIAVGLSAGSAIAISVVVALLSYHLIEQPAMKLKRFFP